MNVFEQGSLDADSSVGYQVLFAGAGKLKVEKAFQMIQKFEPKASVLPASLHLDDKQYMWPFSSQPLYAGECCCGCCVAIQVGACRSHTNNDQHHVDELNGCCRQDCGRP